MRPKKVLLVVMPDPELLSTLSFMLTTNGYRVLGANMPAEAIAKAAGCAINLLLVTQVQQRATRDGLCGADLISRLKTLQPGLPALLFYEDGKFPLDTPADGCVAMPWRSTDLLDRIKVLTARKRGPHKGYKRPVVSDQLSAVAGLAAAGA